MASPLIYLVGIMRDYYTSTVCSVKHFLKNAGQLNRISARKPRSAGSDTANGFKKLYKVLVMIYKTNVTVQGFPPSPGYGGTGRVQGFGK